MDFKSCLLGCVTCMNSSAQILALAFVVLRCVVTHGAMLDDWRPRNPLPTASDLSGVAYGNGRFVAVGNYSTILISNDGLEWSAISQPTNLFTGIAFGGGVFIAAGSQGISSSSEGLDWTRCSSFEVNEVRYVNGRFIAVGPGGVILVSTDGVAWAEVFSDFWSDLTSVTFGNGRYVAVGYSPPLFGPDGAPTPLILTSPDATNWTSQATGALPPFRQIAFGNGTFVASVGNGRFFYSAGAVTWTEVIVPFQYSLWSLTLADGLFFAIGDKETVFTSTNGQTWTLRNSGNTSSFKGLAAGAGKFIVVGTSGVITVSSNSVDWTDANKGFRARLFNCTWVNGQFIAVGGRDSGGFLTDAVIMTSSNGLSWRTQEFTNTTFLAGIASGGGNYIAVGSAGAVFVSSNAESWTLVSIPEPGWDFTDVTYGSNQFVAVATGFRAGGIFTSSDGSNWTKRFNGDDEFLYGITYANGRYVAVGGNILAAADPSIILTSEDGTTWTHRIASVPSRLTGVTYGNGLFVAVLYSPLSTTNTVIASPDGLTWTPRSVGAAEHFNGVAFGENTFVAVALTGAIYTSTNGISWSLRRSNTLQDLWGAAYGTGTFLAVGDAGTILQTEPLRLNLLRSNNIAYLSWPAGGILQRALSVTSDWFNVTRPSNSFVLSNDLQGFYRVRFS